MTTRAGDALDELVELRSRANERFFAGQADRVARVCQTLAERFAAGGRLLAVGGSPTARSDAHHVAVEFVHPVIVGKRALPALAIEPAELELLARPEDAVISFEPLVVCGERFEPPVEDTFVRQELGETLYHVLWELVHVFLDHRGGSGRDAGAAAFLYPFLAEGQAGEDVLEDVRRSVLLKAGEAAALREQTVTKNRAALLAAAAALRTAGTVLALGNGGSATDAADVVADLRAAGRPALDLSADPAIVTALANDVGPEVVFSRQVIAYGRRGDALLALSTSGDSANVIEALAEARRRGLATVALVGYDGGRIAAEQLADHVVVTRSEDVPRIQEAQATAYHLLVELAGRP